MVKKSLLAITAGMILVPALLVGANPSCGGLPGKCHLGFESPAPLSCTDFSLWNPVVVTEFSRQGDAMGGDAGQTRRGCGLSVPQRLPSLGGMASLPIPVRGSTMVVQLMILSQPVAECL